MGSTEQKIYIELEFPMKLAAGLAIPSNRQQMRELIFEMFETLSKSATNRSQFRAFLENQWLWYVHFYEDDEYSEICRELIVIIDKMQTVFMQTEQEEKLKKAFEAVWTKFYRIEMYRQGYSKGEVQCLLLPSGGIECKSSSKTAVWQFLDLITFDKQIANITHKIEAKTAEFAKL